MRSLVEEVLTQLMENEVSGKIGAQRLPRAYAAQSVGDLGAARSQTAPRQLLSHVFGAVPTLGTGAGHRDQWFIHPQVDALVHYCGQSLENARKLD